MSSLLSNPTFFLATATANLLALQFVSFTPLLLLYLEEQTNTLLAQPTLCQRKEANKLSCFGKKQNFNKTSSSLICI